MWHEWLLRNQFGASNEWSCPEGIRVKMNRAWIINRRIRLPGFSSESSFVLCPVSKREFPYSVPVLSFFFYLFEEMKYLVNTSWNKSFHRRYLILYLLTTNSSAAFTLNSFCLKIHIRTMSHGLCNSVYRVDLAVFQMNIIVAWFFSCWLSEDWWKLLIVEGALVKYEEAWLLFGRIFYSVCLFS